MDFNATRGMLNVFTATFTKWFDDDAFLCIKLVSIMKFLLENELDFIKMQEQDESYCTKFLYMLDQGVEKYAEAARRGHLQPTALHFKQIKAAINQRAFTVHLPAKVKNMIRQIKENQRGPKRDTPPDHNRGDRKKRSVDNLAINKNWIMKDGEKYGKVIQPYIWDGIINPPK